MNKRKIMAAAMCAVMSLGLLAGCSSDSSSGTSGAQADAFDYSAALTENGYIDGVKALDYITLPDYKAYKMPKEYTVASAEDIQEQLDTIKSNFTTQEADADTSRAIVDGDTVNIDFVGSVDGKEFENGTTDGKGYDVTIGTTSFIDDFIEQLKGHKPGENFDIEVTFPDEYSNDPSLAGKDAVFNITINHYYKDIVPEITDEFVKTNLSNYYSSVDELMEGIKTRLISTQTKDYIWSKLSDESTISEHSQAALDYEKAVAQASLESTASQYGIDVNSFITMYGYNTMDEYLAGIEENLKDNVFTTLMIQAISEENGWTVSDKDITEYFKTYYGTDDYSAFEDIYGKNYLKMYILSEKVLGNIVDGAVVEG